MGAANSNAIEMVLSFTSDSVIDKDATISVTETIKVLSESRQIRHGIMREFPTRYRDRLGNSVHVGFTLGQTLLDGRPVASKVAHKANGVVIYLGEERTMLKPGIYTYVINYMTTRQIGFFKEYDELYWNVTGNGWRLPIGRVQAHVTMPLLQDPLSLAAYTGPFGAKGKDYEYAVSKGTVTFKTTKMLLPGEGLTIAVSWPKGLVHEPGKATKIGWFLKDNVSLLILLMTIIGILMFYIHAWLGVKRGNKPGVIIPLFEPPAGMLPSEIRYLTKMRYDSQVLASEVVNLAVQGYITVDHNKHFWQSSYIFKKTDKTFEKLPLIQRTIMDAFFNQSPALTLPSSSIAQLAEKIQKILKSQRGSENFYTKSEVISTSFILSIIAVIVAFLWMPGSSALLVMLLSGVLALINFFFARCLTAYTLEGRALMDKIEGFKLFLSTAELERMKIMGTPPTKTPQLYEKYLPYAMALGVEKEWTKQFTPVFKTLEARGTPYNPVWYHGSGFYAFNSAAFSSSLSSSLNSAISSSSTPPGSSSGSGGGGSSGGGGGGGGGGGW